MVPIRARRLLAILLLGSFALSPAMGGGSIIPFDTRVYVPSAFNIEEALTSARLGTVDIPLPTRIIAADVVPFQVWAQGQAYAEAQAADGSWYKVRDITAETFVGRIRDDPYSSVIITMDLVERAVAADVVVDGHSYSVITIDEPREAASVPVLLVENAVHCSEHQQHQELCLLTTLS